GVTGAPHGGSVAGRIERHTISLNLKSIVSASWRDRPPGSSRGPGRRRSLGGAGRNGDQLQEDGDWQGALTWHPLHPACGTDLGPWCFVCWTSRCGTGGVLRPRVVSLASAARGAAAGRSGALASLRSGLLTHRPQRLLNHQAIGLFTQHFGLSELAPAIPRSL